MSLERRLWLRVSLATRVSAFFLVALAVVLGGFSVTLYRLTVSHFQHVLDERLINALDALSAAADVEPGQVSWVKGLRPPPSASHPHEGSMRWIVFDGRGRELGRSPNAPPDTFAEVPDLAPGSGHDHLTLTDSRGQRWRIAVRRILPGAGPGPGELDSVPDLERSLVLATGEPLARVEANLRGAVLFITGFSTGIWMFTAVAGRWLCRRALRPVTGMAASAASMTANDRDQGLPSPGTGDELEGLARSFNGLLGRLHEALERQERFAGDASHQLRTPLTALISEIELARRRERTAEEYRRTLDAVHGDAVRLRRIIESLLFLARAGSESGLPNLEIVELATWLREHIRHWASHERSGDVHLESGHEPSGSFRVKAHPALLGQLLDNLLDNACKYSASGTPVVVSLGRGGGEVTLSVEDQGDGLSPDDLPHIFTPFFRSPRALRGGRPGVGLGLVVVQRIASAFGGRVFVESEPGRGSRFTARFADAGQPSINGNGSDRERSGRTSPLKSNEGLGP